MADATGVKDLMFLACLDLIRRTGAGNVRIGYHDDEKPAIWHVTVEYNHPKSPVQGFEVEAGMTPLIAAQRLCERLVDGGWCTHCSKTTGFDVDYRPRLPEFDNLICWYRYDPEMKTFRRGCE